MGFGKYISFWKYLGVIKRYVVMSQDERLKSIFMCTDNVPLNGVSAAKEILPLYLASCDKRY